MPTIEIIGIWIAVGVTLAILSFLYRDNAIYRVTEQIYVGISAGYYFNIAIFNWVLPQFWVPLEEGRYVVLIPFILGLFIILRIYEDLAWLSRFSYAVLVGSTAGIQIPQIVDSIMLQQVNDTLRPLYPWVGQKPAGEDLSAWIWQILYTPGMDNLVYLLGVFATLMFFFFSVKHTGWIGWLARVGIWFLMVSFGASFGYTVMARVSLLIGRTQFLANPEQGMSGDAFYPSLVLLAVFIIVLAWLTITGRTTAGAGQPGGGGGAGGAP